MPALAAKLPPCKTQACQAHRDTTTLRFFASHPRLAATPAGQRQIILAFQRQVARLTAQVRSLQAARAKPKSNYEETREAVYAVFGSYANHAMAVTDCETGGTWDPRASNGQYQGIFQMGSWERATYGHGDSWLEQAEAAWRYFNASGRGWGPWSCKPWW